MKFKKTTVTVVFEVRSGVRMSVEISGYSFPAPIPLVMHRPIRWTDSPELPRPYFDNRPKYWTVTEPTSGASVAVVLLPRRQEAAERAIVRVTEFIDKIGELVLNHIVRAGQPAKRWKLNNKNECLELPDVDS